MSMRNERSTLSERSESNGPDPLDALIDSAARQIVAGEPSSPLRSSVRDRIEHRRSPWLLAPAIAGAAAMVVIAAVLVGRALLGTPGERENVRPTIERAGTIDVQAPPVVEPAETRSVRLPLPAEAQEERRRRADQERVRVMRRLADDVAALAQLPAEEEPMIPPIAIEPLVTVQLAVGNSIAVESSGVVPIEIKPLQIEPLQDFELPMSNSQLPQAPEI